MLVEGSELRIAVVSGRGEELCRLVKLPFDQDERLAEHGKPAGLLLAHLNPDHGGQPPRPVLRGSREHRHLMGIAFLVRHLGFPEQDVSLHAGVVRCLRPFRRAVIPIGGTGPVMEIPVQPASEFCAVGGKREQLVPDVGLDLADMFRDGTENPEDEWQRLRWPVAPVVRLAPVELLAKERDDRAVKVAAGVVEGGGQVH